MKYADIIVDISLEALDRVFQYLIPEALKSQILVGSQVMVPFGNGNRMVKGYVVGFSEGTEFPPDKIKEVKELIKGSVTIESRMISLAGWMSRRYGCTRAQALKTVLGVRRRVRGGTKRMYRLAVLEDQAKEEMERLSLIPRFAARAAILALLLDGPADEGLSEKQIRRSVPSPENALKTLIKHGWIEVTEASDYRIPFSEISEDKQVFLNEQQQQVVENIWNDERRVQLLYGVTGSGKTEIYMALIERVLQSGKQVIVLIPEISLTYQNIARFRKRFGRRVSVMNSRLSDGERYDQYIRAKNGEIDIMIGPRSALFTPFENLGMIIVDEEQDGAYKSDTTPRYHGVEVAVQRCFAEGGRVVLGSATPSIVSYDKARKGIYGFHRLSKRAAGDGTMAAVEIVDLREELKAKNYSVFSRRLQEEIRQRLLNKEQILLFLNRRGYAGFISCRSCGHVIKCPRCDVSMTLHKSEGNLLKCHYCGYSVPMPKTCPECGSKYIGAFGMGTEKVTELLKKTYPRARILRADRDSMQRKGSMLDIFQTFAEGGADILVGTQMIVKGHDFPNVTLTGILAADLSMFSGDYLAEERTFQLLTQAAGRAGRGDKKGLAIIQTYQPDNYAVVCAARQDYEAFYEQEIIYRQMMGYPPAGQMMVCAVEHEDEMWAAGAAESLFRWMREQDVDVLPPAEGFRPKEKDMYRKVIYIKSREMEKLIRCRDGVQAFIRKEETLKKVNIQFDINPVNLY